MVELERKTWLRRRVEDGLRRGFQRAYETVKVDPAKFLLQVRAAYGLPISNFQASIPWRSTSLMPWRTA